MERGLIQPGILRGLIQGGEEGVTQTGLRAYTSGNEGWGPVTKRKGGI